MHCEKTPRRGATRTGAQLRKLLVPIAVVLGWAAFTPAPASAAQPTWHIESLSNTSVAPGGSLRYRIYAANVGDASTDGSEIDLRATLPSGLTVVEAFASDGSFTCTAGDGVSPVAGASSVLCVSPGGVVLAPGGNGLVQLTVTVSVDPGAPSSVVSSFEVSGGGAATADTVDPTKVTADSLDFGFDAFDGQVTADVAGDPSTQAGGHPHAVSASFDFNTTTNSGPIIGDFWPVEPTKDVLVDLPPGFIGNPTGMPQCSAADLAHMVAFTSEPLCPATSQVGTAIVRVNTGSLNFVQVIGPVPVYNVVPPPDVPARFGMNIDGTVVTLDAEVRSGGDYGLSINSTNIPEGLAVGGTTLTFWGVPSDPSHDALRACPNQPPPFNGGPTCQSGAPPTAFLRNPTSCTASGVGLPTTAHIDSWANPGVFKDATFFSHLPPAYPSPPSDWGPRQGPTDCEKVPFDPKISAQPASPAQAGEPSGFNFDLSLPQSSDPNTIGEADLKKAVVTLPAGMHVSPSSADGLGACTPAQIALHSNADPTCPDTSKIGTVRIDTPLLAQPLNGAIYLATPNDNPFGSLLAIYLTAHGPGVTVKLAGKVDADPSTGQLTTTFDDNPQLPFSDLHLEFKGGSRAPLVNPPACGTYPTHAELTSWSGKTVPADSSFTLSADGSGAPCPPPAQFAPGFLAGTANPVAGGDSPFELSLWRDDQDQQFKSLTVDMPSGVTGRIANAVLCPEGAAQAGTCADVSKIGNVTVGAGAGPAPFFITNGRAYITGPYHGAPFGLSIVVPAVAGPFDLGNVVTRAAIFVNPATAALRVVTDPLPTILQGIPLDIKEIRVSIDRPRFIVNPTSCAQKRVFGTIDSTGGMVGHGSARFQAGECANLQLNPRMTLTVGARGRTRGGVSTPLTATLTQTPGQANLRAVTVSLPTTLNALLPVLNRACTLAQFQAGACGAGARAGSAVAVTPLLRDPLRGSVFFVKNPRRVLPDLMVALRGQVSIDLTGKVSVATRTNRLTTRFDAIPDVPIGKFALRLVAGRNGPLGTTTNLCTAKARQALASIGFRGQNGKLVQVQQRLRILGCARRR
jgi:hypothetical protein